MPKLRLRLWHKFELLAALPLIACAGLLLILGFVYSYSESQIREAQRAKEAINTCEYIVRTLAQDTTNLWVVTKTMKAEEIVLRTRAKLSPKLNRLKELCAEHSEEARTSMQIEEAVNNLLKLMNKAVLMRREQGLTLALKNMGYEMAAPQEVDELNSLNQHLADQLGARLNLTNTLSTAEAMKPFMLTATAIIVLLSLITAFILNRNVVNRLAQLARNSQRLAKLETLKPPAGGDDEIADLDQIFYAMGAALTEGISQERATVEKAADVICTFDCDCNVLSVNPASLEAWGYAASALINKNLLEIVHVEDRERTSRFFSRLGSQIEMSTLENRIIKDNGAAIDVLWSCRKAAMTAEIFSIAHDITERKRVQNNLRKSEARFAVIKEKMPAGIIIFDGTGKVLDCNPAATVMTGRSAPQLGRTAIGEIVPSMQSAALNMVQWRQARESELCLPDGTVRTADVIINSLDSDNGNQFLSVMIDTTERHELERLKETLVAMIAHDIATPMTTIHSQLHLAQVGAFGELTANGSQLVQIAEAQSLELMSVLTTIMKTAKYKHAEILKGVAAIQISDLVDAAVDATAFEFEERQVSAHIQIDRSLRLLIEPDSMTHALKVVTAQALSTCKAGSTLTFESFAKDADDKTMLLRISHANDLPGNAPATLSFEFACAIVKANNGHLKYIADPKCSGFEFELPTC